MLKLFSAQEPRLSVTEISLRLEIPKSTTHNILKSLLAEGLIEKIDGDAYALGTDIIALSQSVRVNVEIRDRAAVRTRQHQRQWAGPERFRQTFGAGIESRDPACRVEIGDMRNQGIE